MPSHSNVYCLSVLLFKGIPWNTDHYKMMVWETFSLNFITWCQSNGRHIRAFRSLIIREVGFICHLLSEGHTNIKVHFSKESTHSCRYLSIYALKSKIILPMWFIDWIIACPCEGKTDTSPESTTFFADYNISKRW